MCCGQNAPRPMFKPTGKSSKPGVVANLINAAKQQPKPFQWARDGIAGIIKCLGLKSIYTDEDIVLNRDACRNCEHSTKNESGKLDVKSQCMAPDPTKNGAPCGCIITCKTQVGSCPLGKWTTLTIEKKTPPNQNSHPEI